MQENKISIITRSSICRIAPDAVYHHLLKQPLLLEVTRLFLCRWNCFLVFLLCLWFCSAVTDSAATPSCWWLCASLKWLFRVNSQETDYGIRRSELLWHVSDTAADCFLSKLYRFTIQLLGCALAGSRAPSMQAWSRGPG